MTTTPVSRSKLSCRNLRLKTEIKEEIRPTSPALQFVTNTPSSKTDGDNDYSPIYFPLTQESNEEIDVLWDWHSPQSSQRKRKKQKRLMPAQSPKFPIRRHPSSNQSQNFERLRNELKALQEELALPDDESVLCVSPQQELEFKGEENNVSFEQELHCDDFIDLFNDSMDEQLILFSQKVENELLSGNTGEENRLNFSSTICDGADTTINNLIDKYSEHKKEDSFHFKHTKATIDVPKHDKVVFQRTLSDNPVSRSTENIIQTVSGKLEFHRTKSFETASLNRQGTVMKNTLEEIERKRLEARAKLEAKKKKDTVTNKSPSKCVPQEIEKKRLQALAKLEAKRLQDIVEKKRQEALKKLQINRAKNASQVKSTLTNRL